MKKVHSGSQLAIDKFLVNQCKPTRDSLKPNSTSDLDYKRIHIHRFCSLRTDVCQNMEWGIRTVV